MPHTRNIGMTRTSNPCAVVLAFAAIAASGTAMAANTITFSGEVTDQTCQVAVNGFTDPTVILDSVPVSALDGAVGRSAGETAFTLQLTDCVAPTAWRSPTGAAGSPAPRPTGCARYRSSEG